MAACPGFEPGTVPTGVPGEAVRGLVSCAHVEPRHAGRGFVAGCTLPGGAPADRGDASALAELIWTERSARDLRVALAASVGG